jgi:hypothetical protein
LPERGGKNRSTSDSKKARRLRECGSRDLFPFRMERKVVPGKGSFVIDQNRQRGTEENNKKY